MGNRIFITARDINVLNLVYDYERVGLDQIQRAFFTSRSACQKRILELTRAKLLYANPLPPRVFRGTGIMVYELGTAGRRLLGIGGRVNKVTSRFMLDHHLAECDFRWSLTKSAQSRGIILKEWITDRQLKKNPLRVLGKPVVADGAFWLLDGERSYYYFVEIDMDQEHQGAIKLKLANYLKLDDCPIVLWVVPSERRKAHVLDWAESVARALGKDPKVFWVAIQGQEPLSPVWTVAGGDHGQDLIGVH